MHSSSRLSLAAALERLEPVLVTVDGSALGEQLWAVADLLAGSAPLRKALTDPARESNDRAELAERLLAGKVARTTVDVVAGLVRTRWSTDADLVEALDRLAVEAVLGAAGQVKALDRVEDELFRFSRVVAANPDLAQALGDRGVTPAARAGVVDRLLTAKVSPTTLALVRHAVAHPRGRRVEAALADLLDAAAARRSRLVAVVVAAVPLSNAQQQRLEATLTRMYGRPVVVEVDVDPGVLGGLRITVGGEVVDATTATRLAELRHRTAG